MDQLLTKVLLWPWFQFWQSEPWPPFSPKWRLLLLLLLVFLIVSLVRLHFLEKTLGARDLPNACKALVRLFLFFVALLCLGQVANTIPEWLNYSRMPIAPHTLKEREIYRKDVSLPHTPVVTESTKAVFLTDYIKIDESSPLGMKIFYAGYVSPGDIMMAIGTIFSGKIAMILFVFVLKEIAQRSWKKLFA